MATPKGNEVPRFGSLVSHRNFHPALHQTPAKDGKNGPIEHGNGPTRRQNHRHSTKVFGEYQQFADLISELLRDLRTVLTFPMITYRSKSFYRTTRSRTLKKLKTSFLMVRTGPMTFRCRYCEGPFPQRAVGEHENNTHFQGMEDLGPYKQEQWGAGPSNPEWVCEWPAVKHVKKKQANTAGICENTGERSHVSFANLQTPRMHCETRIFVYGRSA